MTATSSTEPQPEPRSRYSCAGMVIKGTTFLPRASIARVGPVPALIRGGRWPLPVWLFLVATANPQTAMVYLRSYRWFARQCLGLTGNASGSSLRSTVTRVLAKLVGLKLIVIKEMNHRRILVQVRALDGSGDHYEMPRAPRIKVVHVPTGPLFQNRWHEKLKAIELGALLIALTEESWQHNNFGPHQFEKRRDDIARDYDIAASTWSKAKDGLCAAGLLAWDLPELRPGSRPERVPIDRYTVHAEALRQDAMTAPRFENRYTPIAITAPGTGAPLRMYRSHRTMIPSPSAKVVRLPRPGRDA